jgi:hypothetical protein
LITYTVLERVKMADDKQIEFERRARFDLWTHQNLLFWDRFKILAIIHAAYFGVLAAVKGDPPLMWGTVTVTGILMAILFATLEGDRRLRNFNALKLRTKFSFDPLPAHTTLPWLCTVLGISPNQFEIIFQVFVFLLFGSIDALAVWEYMATYVCVFRFTS